MTLRTFILVGLQNQRLTCSSLRMLAKHAPDNLRQMHKNQRSGQVFEGSGGCENLQSRTSNSRYNLPQPYKCIVEGLYTSSLDP